MLNRWSVLVLVVGLAAGYAISGTSVRAQSEALPFSVGDTVTLQYEAGSQPSWVGDSIECSVLEVRGIYVKCAPTRRFGTQRVENWRSLKSVVQILKKGD